MILDDLPKGWASYSRIQKNHSSVDQPAEIWDLIGSLEVFQEDLGVSGGDFEVVDEVDLDNETDGTGFF